MKLSQIFSAVSLGAVVCYGNFYYQPNGVFVPISLGLSANIQQQLQQPPLGQAQAQQPPPAPAHSSWSLSNLFGLGSWFGGKKSSDSLAPGTHDPAAAMLAQLIAPMRKVTSKFLTRVQTQLETADPKDLATAIRGPLNQLKEYLVSHWPNPEAKTLVLPATAAPPRLPVPAIRGSIAADMARLAHNS
ncbi:hypothetical protein GGH92_002317 [Coemansia sp. RSA 2673]|nr:hypothetical protein GGH13_005353 [Coemansia sp. S155-1]KAJ2350461.1 hypothetical protein GGH92_002317 [Coemansia sp. RSA 2673]